MSVAATAIAALSVEEIVSFIVTFMPAIKALIEVIESHEDEKKRAEALAGITRGLQYAKNTGDTKELEEAIRRHIGSGLPIA